MLLINGNKGISFGFSTNISQYNINDIINYIKNKISTLFDKNYE